MKQHRIALVCDYFYPSYGGVEMHVWSLAQELLQLKHHVIVITHSYQDRVGVRILSNNLRVYYLPFATFAANNTFPAVFHSLPLIREIYIRENIQIVHGHQSTSSLVHESILHGKLMGLKAVFTEHSLYEFGETSSIYLNKSIKNTLGLCEKCIGVSEACRVNLILRASLEPEKVLSIPNAVDCSLFFPDPSMAPTDRINIIVISRLAYRKGVDLVARVIPIACEKWPKVHFIIGGGGPRRLQLDEMVEKHGLHERVELIGEVPHTKVRSVLNRGTIFLNCSLTESFCIAILEAACAGLMVVSTKVGGIPEVLPTDMINFPTPGALTIVDGLIDALEKAILIPIDPWKNHKRLSELYSWRNVAVQTVERVYDNLENSVPLTFTDVFMHYIHSGRFSSVLWIWILAINTMLLSLLNIFRPKEFVSKVPT